LRTLARPAAAEVAPSPAVNDAPQGRSLVGGLTPRPPTGCSRRRIPSWHQIDRTWLYVDDARVSSPFVVVGISSASCTAAGASPTRIVSPYPNTYNAFAGNTAQPGAMFGRRRRRPSLHRPEISMQLFSDRLTIAAGPAFGLSDLSPRLLERLAVAYGF
jgi:hypothetical protein